MSYTLINQLFALLDNSPWIPCKTFSSLRAVFQVYSQEWRGSVPFQMKLNTQAQMLHMQINPCPYAFAAIIEASLYVYGSSTSRKRLKIPTMVEIQPQKTMSSNLSWPCNCSFSWAFNNITQSHSNSSSLLNRLGRDVSARACLQQRFLRSILAALCIPLAPCAILTAASVCPPPLSLAVFLDLDSSSFSCLAMGWLCLSISMYQNISAMYLAHIFRYQTCVQLFQCALV